MARPKREAVAVHPEAESDAPVAILEPAVAVEKHEEQTKPKEHKDELVSLLKERVQILTENIGFLQQEFAQLSGLIGQTFGEPLRTKAAEIVLRAQQKLLK